LSVSHAGLGQATEEKLATGREGTAMDKEEAVRRDEDVGIPSDYFRCDG
jgi:hypothetical protein